jgi:O-succinylbenzoate synthase
LVEQALRCARLDGEARARRVSWWSQGEVPLSHATLTSFSEHEDDAALMAFTHVKAKMSLAQNEELISWAQRHPAPRIRLDFNEVPMPPEFEAWWHALPAPLQARIDWIEDPFLFEAREWRSLQERTGVTLALDRALSDDTVSPDWLSVWKPAWQEMPRSVAKESLVVTSAMDHPVGQAWAAFCAAQAGVTQVCGLRTDHLFARDAFTEAMGAWSPEWPILQGTGMGFDELLENIPWTRIR